MIQIAQTTSYYSMLIVIEHWIAYKTHKRKPNGTVKDDKLVQWTKLHDYELAKLDS